MVFTTRYAGLDVIAQYAQRLRLGTRETAGFVAQIDDLIGTSKPA